MPVPVPPVSTVHTDSLKCTKPGDPTNPHSSVFHLLKCAPLSPPTGPPPSFGSREQWINSLPSWRRAKTRTVWEDDFGSAPFDAPQGFPKGLAGAVDALAIKGAHVQTCIPPLTTSLPSCGLEMPSRNPSSHDQRNSLEFIQDTQSNELVTCSHAVTPELIRGNVHNMRAWPHAHDLFLEDDGGLFAPVLEDDSPDMTNGDTGSSPVEPLTPFGDYVDRAVAASDATIFHDPLALVGSQEPLHLYAHVEAKEESVSTVNEPTAGFIHKQLAEPMAEWLVSYVWKVCTNMLVHPQTFTSYTLPNAPQLRLHVPLYLTARVHSLLMSTLLQPSAMLLALWYIARLPVYFGASGLGAEHVKERRFRVELLGDVHDVVEGESLEGTAAFRLIVLGCMLANKWLDDHTFSNKTWHTISNVPMQTLNKLEYSALDIFSYDLSISPSAWSRWLSHLLSYHHSLTATTHPQPIARPAFNPNALIRKTIQDIVEAPLGHHSNEPAFLGVERRLKERLGLPTLPFEPETFDIDLDEDGPLREEYLPRRRVSSGDYSGARSSDLRNDSQTGVSRHWYMPSFQGDTNLPPPAKWSPAGDEPIYRPSGRTGPAHPPVQPSLAPRYVSAVPAVYHAWPTTSLPYAPLTHHADSDYTQYAYWAPITFPAMQPPQPVHNHVRGYSVAAFDGCHLQPSVSWTPLHQFGYVACRQPLAPHPPPLNFRSTWSRV